MCFSWLTRYFLSQPTFKHWGISNSNPEHTEFPTVRGHTAAQWLLAIYQTQACCLSWSLTLKKCAFAISPAEDLAPRCLRGLFLDKVSGVLGYLCFFLDSSADFSIHSAPFTGALALFLCACYTCEAGGSEVYGQLQQANVSEVSPHCMRPYLKNPKTRAGRWLLGKVCFV